MPLGSNPLIQKYLRTNYSQELSSAGFYLPNGVKSGISPIHCDRISAGPAGLWAVSWSCRLPAADDFVLPDPLCMGLYGSSCAPCWPISGIAGSPPNSAGPAERGWPLGERTKGHRLHFARALGDKNLTPARGSVRLDPGRSRSSFYAICHSG